MTWWLAAMVLSAGFADQVSCPVQGHVSRPQDGDEASFARADHCAGVKADTDLNAVVMVSPTVVATVVVPPHTYARRFLYRWGANHADVGAERLPVAWSRLPRS